MTPRYMLEQRIGVGGMAEVFRARSDDGVFAIKRLKAEHAAVPELRQRLLDEVRIVSRLRHPCVVATHGSYESDGRLHLVMEYVDGVSVEHLIVRGMSGAFIPTKLSAYLVREVARGLAYAHDAGVLHRDVSASNILVGANGEVKLVDFGVADAAGRTPVTAPGQVMGKWTYLSARRRRGETATAADDLFALGVVVERLLDAADPRNHAPSRRRLKVLRDRLTDDDCTLNAGDVVDAIEHSDVADAATLALFLRQPLPTRQPAAAVDLNAPTHPSD